MPTKFAVMVVWLKVYVTIASPMTLTFIQGHKCISNLTTFSFAISRTIFKLLHSNLAWQSNRGCHGCTCWFWWPWPWCKVTVGRQRHTNQRWMLLATKQAISVTLATTVGHFLRDLDFANEYRAWPTCLLLFCFRLLVSSSLRARTLVGGMAQGAQLSPSCIASLTSSWLEWASAAPPTSFPGWPAIPRSSPPTEGAALVWLAEVCIRYC